jgi:hypothetical protein
MHTASTFWLTCLIFACAISCTPIPQASIPNHQPSFPKIAEPVTQPEAIPHAITTHPISAPAVASKTLSNIQFQGVAFDSRSHTLKPIDQANGPGTQYLSARDCATKQQALLAINAGFFTPEGEPLGLVISNRKYSGSWNSSSSLGSGIYRIDPSGITSISRRTQSSAVSNSKELLQAGPLLIENHQPISGLDPSKVAMRSVLLHDGGHRWWIGIASPCSLADLSTTLSSQSPAGWKISHALNLDGGRSTDLFVSSEISGGSLEQKSLMNRQVRNFLVLQAR